MPSGNKRHLEGHVERLQVEKEREPGFFVCLFLIFLKKEGGRGSTFIEFKGRA